MEFTRQFEANRRALVADVFVRLEQALIPFQLALDAFLAALFNGQTLPPDWRQQWRDFVAAQKSKGYAVSPESAREMEEWIERWAGYWGLLPAAEVLPLPKKPPKKRRPRGRPIYGAAEARRKREAFFDSKLALAARHLEAIGPILQSLARKLEAAKENEEIDVDAEVNHIDRLIWQYNDALESARDEWLRKDLGGTTYDRLVLLSTPAAFGLPLFTDIDQAKRAKQQERTIGQRLGTRIRTLDFIIGVMEAAEWAGTIAEILIPGVLLYQAIKVGGKWALRKALKEGAKAAVSGAVGAGVVLGADRAMRTIGVPEEAIPAIILVAELVGMILLRRRMRGNSGKAIHPETEAPKANAADNWRTNVDPIRRRIPAGQEPERRSGGRYAQQHNRIAECRLRIYLRLKGPAETTIAGC